MDDKDVRADIKREEFEELLAPLLARLQAPLQQVLDVANLTIKDVDAVELIGGSTRIPIIKETLAKFFGGSIDGENKLSTTLNQDEAVARGCALQCAIISPVFKVRDFEVVDYNSYPVVLSWDPSIVPPLKSGGAGDSRVEIYPEANTIPNVKASRLLTSELDSLQNSC